MKGVIKIESLFKEIIILVVCIIYLLWKKYHIWYVENNKYIDPMKEWFNMLFASVAVVILVAGIELWGWFAEIYIAIPIIISMLYLLRRKDESFWGFYIILKGTYYFILAIYSAIQYYTKSANLAESAIGFTISLSIFESITAFSDGYQKIRQKKPNKENKTTPL